MKVFFIACFLLFGLTTSKAQCLISGNSLSNQITYKTTGIEKLDAYLNTEKAYLEDVFKVRVDMIVLDDSGAPNCYATSYTYNPLHFDGSVYMGINLLTKELYQRENGIDAVTGIMAHEFAHVLQEKLDCNLQGMNRELHADFLAGYYIGKRKKYDENALMAFAKSLYEKGDSELWNEDHHGTPKQRVQAMSLGYASTLQKEVLLPKDAYLVGINVLTNGGNQGGLDGKSTNRSGVATSVTVTIGKQQYNHVFTVLFKVNDVQYQGLMLLDEEGDGLMRLRFTDNSAEKIISQVMRTQKIAGLECIQGSDPMDVVEQMSSQTYSPDRFCLQNDKFFISDDQGNSGDVELRLLTDEKILSQYITYLYW